jgi:hypothetical protein
MVARVAVDSPPPPPAPRPPPAPYVYAATDERPRTAEERKLCEKASHPDWLYLGSGVVLTAGAIVLDQLALKSASTSEGVRYLGPSAVGLTWGFTLGGAYLSLPKCSPDYVTSDPPEGDVRTNWEIAIVFAALAGLTAPILESVETGTIPPAWSNAERAMRLVLASAFGVAGAFIPYVLPPKTWRAAKKLENLRASPTADGRGGFVSWGIRF